ncbi:MAG: VWA domain-containing protein [Polyangiaceae bacterium]|nr:VWA domain-containing protein [Polyangiaceae bacterium]
MSRRTSFPGGRIRALARGPWLLLVALVALVALAPACQKPHAHEPGQHAQGDDPDGPLPPIVGLPAPPLEPLQVLTPASNAMGASFPVFTDPGEVPTLRVVPAEGSGAGGAKGQGDLLPLEHTHVRAALHGFVGEIEVTQTYKNPSTRPIEAVYVFPLPENSAVHAMRIQIGERVIEAEIQERGEARRIYESAKRQGYTAALLEQERANVFTQSVANIEPGKKIDVTVRYVQDLSYDAGEYEFVFPMVVGPRFIQPTGPAPGLQGGHTEGSGTYVDTPAVPDASRITPPIYGRGERPGHDISIEVVADAGTTVGDVSVPTHEVVVRRPADGTLRLTLAEKDALPNRDFVLRYRAVGATPMASLLTSGGSEGYFSLVVHPPALDVDALVGQRELVFVVDVSGSMSGQPLARCQAAMREAVARMRPVDTFNVITFAGATAKLFPRPRPANNDNVREALGFVDRMTAGGGTYMLDAVSAALTPDVGDGRNRYVFFMTDGYVGIEDQIIGGTRTFVSRIEAEGRKARVFGFGVGSSVNRALIEGLSREGKGLAVYATNREDPARAVNQFYRYIDRSVLRELTIDWGDFAVSDVLPAELPDLFASHPLVVHGRYRGTPSAGIRVRALSATGALEVPVAVVEAPADAPRAAQGSLWARSKIAWLEPELMGAQAADVKSQITALGLEHRLVTRFTSFVAVDASRKVGDGTPDRIVQPVAVPEGVDGDMAGARVSPQGTVKKPPVGPAPVAPSPAPRPEVVSLPTAAPPTVTLDPGPALQTSPSPSPVAGMSPGSSGDYRAGESSKSAAGLDEELRLDAAPAPPEAAYGKRGCHCGVVGQGEGAPLGWLAALAGLGAFGLRLRRRRLR